MYKFKIILIVLSIILFCIKQCENREKQRANQLLEEVQPLLGNPELYIKGIKNKYTENNK